MVREAWTDERLDDLANRMDEGFREVRAELRQQREENAAEFAAVRSQITDESTSLRKEFAEVREVLGQQRAEVKDQKETMEAKLETIDAKFEVIDAKFEKVDARFDDLNRTLQIGFWLIGSFIVGLMGMVATQL